MRYFKSNKKYKDRDDILANILILIIILIVAAIQEIERHPIIILYVVLFIILISILSSFISKKKEEEKEKPASLPKEYFKKYPIIIQYTPPKWINPAEAWLLYNCKVDVTDLTSLIYQWTLDWILSIRNISWKDSNHVEKIELTKLKDIPSDHPFFEREIFNSLFFAWNQKTITYSTQLKYALILEDLEMHGIKQWRVCKSETSRIREKIFYYAVWILLLSTIIIFLITRLEDHKTLFFISLTLLALCIWLWWYIFWWKPLKLTEKWAELASHVIWYRNFIKSCDENKIKLFLKEDPLFIDKILPYATAFWIETEFIKKITPLKENLYGTLPTFHEANAKSYWWQEEKVGLSTLISYLLKN